MSRTWSWLLLGSLLVGLPSISGCISRVKEPSVERRAEFEAWVAELGAETPAEVSEMPRGRGYLDFRMHLRARTSCSGSLEKTQRTEALAWVTSPGWSGPERAVKLLSLRFRYGGGFFRDIQTYFSAQKSSSSYGYEEISGLESSVLQREPICTCVRVSAVAVHKKGTTRAHENVCPAE